MESEREGTSRSLFGEELELVANIQELQRQLQEVRDDQETSANPFEREEEVASLLQENDTDSTHQIIIVTQELPVSVWRDQKTGKWNAQWSTGRLDKLMCLLPVRGQYPYLWVGWLRGTDTTKREQEEIRTLLLKLFNCIPVFMASQQISTSYDEFCRNVIWPLFHYNEALAAESLPESSGFKAYVKANQAFAEVVEKHHDEGDLLWIHDYHLMMLPELVRKSQPSAKIGWFLHTPFPSSEIFMILPFRATVLKALLRSDLIGFQTYDYARHFFTACSRLLGVECTPRGIQIGEHFTRICVHPIGLNTQRLKKVL
jgi:trehalose 6-phosphate synthase/phosphatase